VFWTAETFCMQRENGKNAAAVKMQPNYEALPLSVRSDRLKDDWKLTPENGEWRRQQHNY
jgi:hypothetical protein